MKKTILKIVCLFTFVYSFSQDTVLVNKLLDEAYGFEAKNPEKALAIYRKAYKISTDINYPIGAFKSTMYSGIVKSDLAQYDSALFYYKKALPLSEKTNSPRDRAVTYVNMGNVYQFKGELDSVPDYYLRAIKSFELAKDSISISNVYINLATLFQTLDQTEKQIEYLKIAIKTIPRHAENLLGLSYGNLGLAYIDQNNSELAFKYFILSDSISKNGRYPRLRFFSERNLGEYHFFKKSYEKAISYYQKALKEGEAINDAYFKNDVLLNLGLAYNELKNFVKAEYYLRKAFDMGANARAIEIQQKASLNLAEIKQSQGDIKSALDYYKTYSILKDSLTGLEKVKAINEIETKYQSEKKDKELAQQDLKIEKQQSELQKRKSQYALMTGLAIFLLVASVLSWFSYRQRQKRKNQEILTLRREQQVKTLESLVEGEEKERLRIAKELHDGVNGDLSAIKYKLTAMVEHSTDVVNEVVAMLDHSSEQVRAISHNLVPPALEKFELTEALEDYAASMNDIHEPEISFQFLGNPIQLPKKIEVNLYRIVQELLSNSIKHAQASEITVQISHQQGNLLITVEDNGIGFDPQQTNRKGIGLTNIQSRIDYLKAKKDLVSNEKGTTYSIEIDTRKLNDH